MISVLLVEDNQSKIKAVASVINSGSDGHELAIVMNARDAKEELRKKRFDLLLLDINLPLTPESHPVADGGLELLRWLKARGQGYRPTYIVGITAFEDSFKKAQTEFDNLIWQVISVQLSHNEWQKQLRESVNIISDQVKPPFIGDGSTYKTDILVVTALPEPELSAILALPLGMEKISVKHDSSLYYRGRLVDDRKSASIVAVSASDKGLAGAAIAAMKGVYTFWPRYLFMAGITAGLKGRTRIGDVIFADPSWDWGSGKLRQTKEKEGEEFLLAPYQRRLDETFATAAKELDADSEFRARIWKETSLAKPPKPPKIRVGGMASGASVLQSSAAVKRVLKQHKDILAIEMEAFSVMFSGQTSPTPRPIPIVAKAVCDFGDGTKNNKYQEYAAYTSARVFAEFARRYLTKRS